MSNPITYTSATALLRDAGVASAAYEARLLISEFCGVDPSELLAHPEKEYESEALEGALRQRSERYPLQYILGRVGFRECSFRVTEDTLIPRPDTELLVEYAVSRLPENACFADLCTGSGCVAISALFERPDVHGVATDISAAALAIASENAKSNGVDTRLEIICEDLRIPSAILKHAPFDAILSNPPYIRSSDLCSLEKELDFEPRIALDGGGDGLEIYRAILDIYPPLLAAQGFIALEIGYDQEEAIQQLARQRSMNCTVLRDYGANPRVAVITKN